MKTHEKYRQNRTNTNWSEHELIIKEDKYSKIWELKKPGTCIGLVRFINVCGTLSVNGDYGNWIFCREFHPSVEGYVSDGYWIEKLEMVSTQKGTEYDPVATDQAINERINEKDWSDEDSEEMEEYFQECLNCVHDELDYTQYAYHKYPNFCDHEIVIFCTKTKYWLNVVFDAFDEVCRRLDK